MPRLRCFGRTMRAFGRVLRAPDNLPAVGTNTAPVASFTSTVTNLIVQVNGSGSTDVDGPITAYAWSWGDGTTSTGITASHTYAAAADYTITLTVTDDDGVTATTSQQVTATEPVPEPEPEPEPDPNVEPAAAFTSAISDLSIVVDATNSTDADGTITGYWWDFGDGGDATGVTASHEYIAADTYTVTLTVSDDAGASATITEQITVTAPVNAVAAPVLTSISEPLPRSTRVERNPVPAGHVWDLYDASKPDVPVDPNLTEPFRQSGQWLFEGTTYTYFAIERRLSDGVESAPSNSLTITLASSTTEPDPEPTPDPTEGLIARSTEDFPEGWENFTKIAWFPPKSTTPTPAGYTAVRDRRLFLDHTTDYRIICPEPFIDEVDGVFVDVTLEINGGRNWVIQGTQGEMTSCHFGDFTPGKDYHTYDTDPGSRKNRFLRVNGRNGYGVNTEPVTRVLEGAYAKGQWFWEGIEFDCKDDRSAGLKWIVQNYRSDQINFVESPNGKHFGGDVIQPYAGPGQLIIRGLVGAECTYQGGFWQMDGGVMPDDQVVSVSFSRIVLTGSRTWGHGYLWYDTVRGNTNPAVAYTYGAKGTADGVYIDPAPGTVTQTTHMDALGRESVTIGPSPHGDPVPAQYVGVNYPYAIPGGESAPAFTLGTTEPVDANTGAGVSDVDAQRAAPTIVVEGNVTVAAGQVYKDRIINGFVDIDGSSNPGTLENCIVRGPATELTSGTRPVVRSINVPEPLVKNAPRAKVRFVTIDPQTPSARYDAWGYRNLHVYRSKAYRTVDGGQHFSQQANGVCNVLVEGSLVAESVRFAPDYANGNRAETHNDTLFQAQGNNSDPDDIRYVGCSGNARHSLTAGHPPTTPEMHEASGIAAVMTSLNTQPQISYTLDRCWLRGGVQTVNAGEPNPTGHIKVVDSRFEKPGSAADNRDPLAALAIDAGTPRTVSGNKYFDGTNVEIYAA